MLKLTLEDDTGMVGFKDKNAWTVQDCNRIYLEIIKQVFDLPDDTMIEVKQKLPLTNTDASVMSEGM